MPGPAKPRRARHAQGQRRSAPPAPHPRSDASLIGAWFLGPSAENGPLEEEMLLHILRDYFYWRRNHYPTDRILIPETLRREHTAWRDDLSQTVNEMLAALKRHFPFYSPRYIAHQLSDQTIPGVLGYFAGMLYNPNNVSPEGAPVTVDWELEVGRDLLGMLGYTRHGSAGREAADDPRRSSHSAGSTGANGRDGHPETPGPDARATTGWAHLTSGGTIANVEALWVARAVRSFPVAVRHALIALRKGRPARLALPFPIRLARGERKSAPAGREIDLAGLTDRQCLELPPAAALSLIERFVSLVHRELDLPPAEAAAHAWDLLRQTGFLISHSGSAPITSIAEPVILVSGAAHYSIAKAADVLGLGRACVRIVDVDRRFRIDRLALRDAIDDAGRRGQTILSVVAIAGTTEEGAVDPIHEIAAMRDELEHRDGRTFWLHIDAAWGGYLRSVFVNGGDPGAEGNGRAEAAAIEDAGRFVSRPLTIRDGAFIHETTLEWSEPAVCRAFLAFPRADSITVDPHKMGYLPYPSGAVAFKSDSVRHLVAQRAAYIGQLDHSAPPRADGRAGAAAPAQPDSIGPYILEGSKPGAAAAAARLSHRMIPPTRAGYGQLARASLLATRELFERITTWDRACRSGRRTTGYKLVPISDEPPDTNLLCFIVRRNAYIPLATLNLLNERIHQRFTISDRDGATGYTLPFFISRTVFKEPEYPRSALAPLLERLEIPPEDYQRDGLFVLRCTLMSPYITFAAESGSTTNPGPEYLAEFMHALHAAAETAVAETR